MVYDAGAKEAHVRICSPPVIKQLCHTSTDMRAYSQRIGARNGEKNSGIIGVRIPCAIFPWKIRSL